MNIIKDKQQLSDIFNYFEYERPAFFQDKFPSANFFKKVIVDQMTKKPKMIFGLSQDI